MAIYTIKPGDTLYSLSQRYGVPVDKIMTDNSLEDADNLVIGQSLAIMSDAVNHVVRRGDTLYNLARNYGTTVANIFNSNSYIFRPSELKVGQIITIPLSEPKLGTITVNGFVFSNISDEVLEKTLPNLTFISIFSHEVRPDGSLSKVNDQRVIDAARAKNVAPLLVITNIKEGGSFNSELAATILDNVEVQDILIDNLLRELSRGYSGINIDFEYVFEEYKDQYNQFIRKMATTLQPLGYIVTTSLAPKTSADQKGLLYEAHDYGFNGAYMDYVVLMTYEWGYTYGPAEAVSPVNKIKRVLDYATSVIPSEQILMGIPNYGYDWTLPFKKGTAAESISHTAAVRLASEVGVRINFDTVAQAPYFNYYDASANKHEVWFDDARGIAAKLRLVNEYALGGISYWTLNRYFPQNWVVLRSMYDVRKIL